MFYFSRPAGFLQVGKALTRMPAADVRALGAPCRILFVTDMHIRRNTWKTAENVYALIEREKPELLIFGGDFAENDASFTRFFEGMKGFSCPLGMYAVEGNNEANRLGGDRERVKACMEQAGVRLLRDECVSVQAPGGRIELAGIKNAYIYEAPCAKNLFSRENGVYRILLAHEPLLKYLHEAEGMPDLLLGGHTHGGQLNILGITCYEILNYESNYRFTNLAGLKRIGNTDCLVSRGIGTSKFAVRFGARSEVHVIE